MSAETTLSPSEFAATEFTVGRQRRLLVSGDRPLSGEPAATDHAFQGIAGIKTQEELAAAIENQSLKPVVKTGQALLELGAITDAQLDLALKAQQSEPGSQLGEILVNQGFISHEQLRMALATKMGIPLVDTVNFPVDVASLMLLPVEAAVKYSMVPLMRIGPSLVVAADDPLGLSTKEDLRFALGRKVIPVLSEQHIDDALIDGIYAEFGLSGEQGRYGSLTDQLRKAGAQDLGSAGDLVESLEAVASPASDIAETDIAPNDNALVRLINHIIIEANFHGASDIHIETYSGKRKIRVRLRKDGKLKTHLELPHGLRSAMISRIKVMANLDISDRRTPQDGKIDFSKYMPRLALELRVATIPTHDGAEDVVMRLLSSARPKPLRDLDFSDDNRAMLSRLIQRPHGLILCVGPTGSGKTTTLHAVLQELNTPDRKIWTAEDPIEITNPDLRQIQVNVKAGLTFASALRTFLRADPDVIMVGEVRDRETAQMCLEASLTGHMVLSTLHTNSATETVVRLLDMGIDPFSLADSLVAVVAQRLVRRLCPRCAVSGPADEQDVRELAQEFLSYYPEDMRPDMDSTLDAWRARYSQNGRLLLKRAVGCRECDQIGYRGRIAIQELMPISPGMRRLIHGKRPSEEVEREAFRGKAFHTIVQDGIFKCLQGLTTPSEVRAYSMG